MWQTLLQILLLVVGMALLIKGADFFVDGASAVARAMKISPLIIGLTLVSIGTSLPELSVSLTAAVTGKNDMGLGNVVGSNIFNTFVVIGASALFTTMVVSKSMKKYDIPVLLGIYALLATFAFALTPGVISRVESIVIFALMFAYIAFLIIRSKRGEEETPAEDDEKQRKWYWNLLFILLGGAAIIGGGTLTVNAAEHIALKLGMSELLVGLTVVAVGTSLPELVTSMVAAKKGENDIAVGNAIGSSIFNVVLILGLTGIISPIKVATSSWVDVAVMALSAVMVWLFALKSSKVGKWQGVSLILVYAAYLTYIILRNMAIL
ncbi:MAG: calcium/sodium antiporter [Clostridiales bacterium]|nr:calcium/sodium antiporter [Clostridiales bacterium]